MPVKLPAAQSLVIAGPDAIAFAHAQFASDVRALREQSWQWSAWLSAQGRVRALFQLLRTGEDRLVLVLRGGAADALRAALAPFVFRARVHLRAAIMSAVGSFDRDEAMRMLGAAPDAFDLATRDGTIGLAMPGSSPRWYALTEAADAAQSAPEMLERWRLADIDAGLALLEEEQLGRFLPDWLGLRRLAAVSVAKGCYPGQEIVARLHFKGGGGRHLYRVAFDAPALPRPATPLSAAPSAGPSGELLNAAWEAAPHGVALAVLSDLASGSELTAPAGTGKFRVVCPVEAASD